ASVDVTISTADDFAQTILRGYKNFIMTLAKVREVTLGRESVAASGLHAVALAGDIEIQVPLAGLIDVAVELPRLEKEVKKATSESSSLEHKLSNPNFAARAPTEVVEETKQRLQDSLARTRKLQTMIERLKSA